MDYQINFSNYKNNFSLPQLIVGEDLPQINSDYLKVILFIFKNPDKNYSVNLLSNLLNLSDQLIEESLRYWIQKGVLLSQEEKETSLKTVSLSHDSQKTPLYDSELKFLFSEMETILGRPITSTDIKTITYIYEAYRLPADVIIMGLEYCVEKGKQDIRYIEKVLVGWYHDGITSHAEVEAFFKRSSEKQQNQNKIRKLFGIGDRKLIPSEEKYIEAWFGEYHFDLDVIQLAYDRTIKNTGKVAFAYTNKILSNWHEKGYCVVEDILKKENGKSTFISDKDKKSYDIDYLDKYWDKVPTLD